MSKAVSITRHIDEGLPKPEDFSIIDVPAPDLGDATDKVVVELVYVSVDPYLRGRMRHNPNYFVPCYQPGKPLSGPGIGVVKKSKSDRLPEGAFVQGELLWQQVQLVSVEGLQRLDDAPLKALNLPTSLYLGALGMVGMTAYGSLKKIGQPKKGDTVFVSGAAGAVGVLVGQLCKHVYGCANVVGSAGSDEKVAKLKEFGYDAAFNYKTMSNKDAFAKYCPNGIDVYFDNVGGETLETVLDHVNVHARVVCCGSISQYNNAPGDAYGVKNLFQVINRRVLMQGFLGFEYYAELAQQFMSDMSQYLKEGKAGTIHVPRRWLVLMPGWHVTGIVSKYPPMTFVLHVKNVEHVTQGGLEACGSGFIDMMNGKNIGKAIVQVGNDPHRK